MSAIGDWRTSRAFPALMVLLALVWLVSVAAPAPANGPAAHVAVATSANGRAAMVRQHGVFGGLVANRGDKSGRYGPILLAMQTGALETALLVAAGFGLAAAVCPRRRTQPALVEARAPPLLQLA